MRFERVHIALLAVMSIFTGVIAPIVVIDNSQVPLPMTNMRDIGVMIMLLLPFMFYLAMERRWKVYHFLAALITLGVGYILILYFLGNIGDIRTDLYADRLSWGWAFFLVGIGGFFIQAKKTFYEQDTMRTSTMIDHVVGIMGAVILLGLSGIILFISLYGNTKKGDTPVLASLYEKSELIVTSGAILSPAMSGSIQRLEYDRGKDILSFITRQGEMSSLVSSLGSSLTGSYTMIRPIVLHQENSSLLIRDGTGIVLLEDDMRTPISEYRESDGAVLSKGENGWRVSSPGKSFTLAYTGKIDRFALDKYSENILWSDTINDRSSFWKNEEKLFDATGSTLGIAISENGYDTMALLSSDDTYRVYKNKNIVYTGSNPSIRTSWKSNGSNFISIEKKENIHRINFNGDILPKELEEVREIFLEETGGSYAYFARPIGEKKWCLFTRYRGNLCGLDGYMNPRLGADGGSIIFAGYKDGIWSIYRNTEVIIRDTGYANTSISRDYFFVDTTNPKKYIFYLYDAKSDAYSIQKNGDILPEKWQDVGLDVYFGYGNTVILSVKRNGLWHIAELK